MNQRRIIVGTILSIAFIYFIIWIPQPLGWLQGELNFTQALFGRARIDFNALINSLLQVRLLPLFLAFLVTPAHCLIRAHRWKTIVKPLGRLGLFDGFGIIVVGYFVNTILPLRVGEIARGVLLGKRLNISKSSGLGSVAFDRALDVCALLIVVAITGFLFRLPDEVRQASRVLLVIVLFIIVILAYLIIHGDSISALVKKLLTPLPRKTRNFLVATLDNFISGFASLKTPGSYSTIIIDSILIWLLYAAQVILVLFAFNFYQLYPLIQMSSILSAFVIVIASAIVLSVPSAPAGIGTFHAGIIFSLALFDVGIDEATGFAIIIHAITIIFYLVFGSIFMWHEGLKLGQLQKIKEDPTEV